MTVLVSPSGPTLLLERHSHTLVLRVALTARAPAALTGVETQRGRGGDATETNML